MIETLVGLKRRLVKGTQVRQIWNSREGEVEHFFTIEKVHTEQVAASCADLTGLYWMSFPKRSDIIFTEKGWIRMKGERKMAEYVWVDEEEKGERTHSSTAESDRGCRTPRVY